MKTTHPQLSLVIPAYNEEENIVPFYKQLITELGKDEKLTFEIIYVNDGSRDDTVTHIKKIAKKDDRVRLINLSRNFGKEIATTAGIHHAHGDAIMMIDADGQHPPELIHEFIKKWQAGAKVVIGVRKSNQKEGVVKRYGSKLFYKLLNSTAGVRMAPGSTDFTLIDRAVKKDFFKLTERNRITRGLIGWIGYSRDIVEFSAKPRMAGQVGYKISKLVKLAMNSFVSLSLKPLFISGWVGVVFLLFSAAVLLFLLVEQLLLGDPLGLRVTGTAVLAFLLIGLVGMLLISQGLTALHISHIHAETQNRPLYVVDEADSIRL